MLDPTGALVVELRDGLVAAGLTDRVRVMEPGPDDASWSVDPTSKLRRYSHEFVVIVALNVPPDGRLPITDARYAVRCYGLTLQRASALYGAVVDVIHGLGPRVKSSGLGIYRSEVESGGSQSRDPDTQQPVVSGVIHLIATTQAVT